jgi:hypothetical protein
MVDNEREPGDEFPEDNWEDDAAESENSGTAAQTTRDASPRRRRGRRGDRKERELTDELVSAYDEAPPVKREVSNPTEPAASHTGSAPVNVSGTRRRPPPPVVDGWGDVEPSQPISPAGRGRGRGQGRYAPPRRRGYGCADVITALFLLMTVLVVSGTILLLQNPQSPLNPLPPPTFPPQQVLATLPPTETPTETPTNEPPTPTIPTATPTDSPTPTETPTPTVTATPVVGGIVTLTPAGPAAATAAEPTQPAGTRPPFPFSVKSIRYQKNDGPGGCKWQSIAGVVFNLEGVPRRRDEGSLTVRVTSVDGIIDEFHFTGEQPRFGESGFEAFLGETPRIADYSIQLLGVTGAPISEKVTVQTRATCEEAVALIEFVQNYTY